MYISTFPWLAASRSVARAARLFLLCCCGATGLAAEKKSGGRVRDPLPVVTQVVAPAELNETISATGTLRADEAVELHVEIAGKLVVLDFDEGQPVRAGQRLVKINDADLQASLERAQQRRVLAELKEQRMRALVQGGGVNQQDYDAAVSELRVQQADEQLIRAQIAKTEIRAPFDGVVGLRDVSVGAFVTPATRIATLQKTDGLKLDFAVPERHLPRVRVGDTVTFRVSGSPREFRAEIYAVEPKIDLATRTALLRARCTNPDGALLPGAFAQIAVTLSRAADALLVPATAVVSSGAEKAVFVVEQGVAVRRPIETGLRESGSVQVLRGLAAGDVLIVAGVQQVRAGAAVHPIVAAVSN